LQLVLDYKNRIGRVNKMSRVILAFSYQSLCKSRHGNFELPFPFSITPLFFLKGADDNRDGDGGGEDDDDDDSDNDKNDSYTTDTNIINQRIKCT
jgi:hypothetical protein